MGILDRIDAASSVSAADLVRSFPKCRDDANKAPLFITHHGRPTHVLMATKSFIDWQRRAFATHADEGSRSIFALTDHMEEAAICLDQHGVIRHMNHLVAGLCPPAHSGMIGQNFFEMFPECADSQIGPQVSRTLRSGEQNSVEAPSPFRENSWIRCRSFRVHDYVIVQLRDISVQIERERLADAKGAIVDAIAQHGSVFYVQLSVRGTIRKCDRGFADLVGLSEERLAGVALADMVAVQGRADLRNAIEDVFSQKSGHVIQVDFLANGAHGIRSEVSLAPLRHVHGTEGAVAIITVSEAR